MEKYIVFEDKDILILNKPFGMLSQKDKKETDEDLYTLAEKYILKKDKNAKVGLINRLDRVVGGLVLFGKNEKINKCLTEKMKEGGFSKYYLAIVCGSAKESDIIINWIMKNQRLNISKIVNKNSSGSKEAKLTYKKIAEKEIDLEILSLIEIKLFTGRHHQIRVQMANAGLPLYKDTKYNPKYLRKRGIGEIGLFANKLEFIHPITNENIKVEIMPKNENIFKEFLQ